MNFSRSFKKSYLDFKIPAIMGILNITPDSFSDGGKFNKKGLGYKQAISFSKFGSPIPPVVSAKIILKTLAGCFTENPNADIPPID